LAGFQSAAVRDSLGTTLFSISRRFALTSAVNCAPPVRFPPGCARNGLGRVLDGKGCGRRDHDDYVDIESNHLCRKLLEALSLASCIPALNDEVAALLVPVSTQALEQRVIETFVSVGDKSHPPNFVSLLRERIERPRRRAAEEHDERAPFHSATSPSSHGDARAFNQC
jgi:hypothetical protein